MKSIIGLYLVVMATACQNIKHPTKTNYKTIGTIERLDPALDVIIDTSTVIEIIAEGFNWSEGPLWVESEQMLLFSDVPRNTVYKWTEAKGTAVYLSPSGYTGTEPTQSREPGSNGLLLDNEGNLVLCQHGNRQVARMDATLDAPQATYITLIDRYNGLRFSSPNDAVFNKTGDLFFTDPPYGLPSQNDEDPAKETTFNGVYKVNPNGETTVLTDQITRPNGIALFPGEDRLLVANSDPAAANWYIVDTTQMVAPPTLFYSATNERAGVNGLPDGLKIDSKGTVFASGPGGIWIFNSNGTVLGKLKLDEPTSNVALSADEKTMFITNNKAVLRVKLGSR